MDGLWGALGWGSGRLRGFGVARRGSGAWREEGEAEGCGGGAKGWLSMAGGGGGGGRVPDRRRRRGRGRSARPAEVLHMERHSAVVIRHRSHIIGDE